MVLALCNLAQQRAHASALGMGQLAESLLLLRCPFPESTGMTSIIQPSQAKLVPALPPLLNAVQMHSELICGFLQRQPLAQPQNSLCSHPCARMWVEHTHLTKRARSSSDNSKCFIAQPLLRDQLALTAKIGRLIR